MEHRCHEMLDDAARSGVTYVDAARSYGKAEEFLASWVASWVASRETSAAPLPPLPPLTIGSKWGYRYVGRWRMDAELHEVKDHSLEMFREQIRESRGLLGPHLDLYQVHSVTPDDPLFGDRALLSELATTARAGDGLRIGLSVSGADQRDAVRRAMEVEVDGLRLFSCVQATWNLFETSVGSALCEAHTEGLGVIVKEVLANGRLSDRGFEVSAEKSGLSAVKRELSSVAEAHEKPVETVAFAAALSEPWADVVLSGAVNERQLATGLGSFGLEISQEERGVLRGLAEEPAVYWRERSGLAWH